MNLSESSPESDFSLSDHTDSGLSSGDAAFHDQIKNVLFDVEIPEGLKDSVLASLSQNHVTDLSNDQTVAMSRRDFLKKPGVITGLSVCLMFLMMLTYFWATQEPVLALSEFSPELNLDSRLLSEFDNNFSEQFPVHGGWRLKGRLVFTSKSYGISVGDASKHDAVVRFFTLPTGGEKVIYGSLFQVPAGRVEPLPSHASFDPDNVAYAQLKKGNYATVKWVEDDRVYICIVFGGSRELEAVRHALQFTSA